MDGIWEALHWVSFLTKVSLFTYPHPHVQRPAGKRSVHGVPRTHSLPLPVHIQRVPWCSHPGNMSQRHSPLGFWWPKAIMTKCHSHLIVSWLRWNQFLGGQRAKFVARPGADIPFYRVDLSNKPSPCGKWWLQHPQNRNRASTDFFCSYPELSQAHQRQEKVSRWEGLPEGPGAGVGSSGKLCRQLGSVSGSAQTPVGPWPLLCELTGQDPMISMVRPSCQDSVFLFPIVNIMVIPLYPRLWMALLQYLEKHFWYIIKCVLFSSANCSPFYTEVLLQSKWSH